MTARELVRAKRLQKDLDAASQAFADGKTRRALALAKEVCAQAPDQPAGFAAAGHFAIACQDYVEARIAYRRAVELAPTQIEFLANLALAEAFLGAPAQAIQHLEYALTLAPDAKFLWANLGNAINLASNGADPAHAAFKRALALDPNYFAARMSYAHSLSEAGAPDAAAEQLRICLHQDPASTEARLALVAVLDDQLRTDEAVQAIREGNNRRIAQAGLMRANYDETLTQVALFDLHRAWGTGTPRQTPMLRTPQLVHSQPLRVALLSPDFRNHAVTRFVNPLVAGAEGTGLRVHLYNDVVSNDAHAVAMRKRVGNRWRNVFGQDAEQLAKNLRADRIDVLIELAGHTNGNRLDDLAGRVAPWQGTWLGYPNTTGVPAIDFRLVDAITDPAPHADGFASEKLVRVETCFLAYAPPNEAPDPKMRVGAPIYGSANNFQKAGPATIALWAQVLHAMPDAKLALKSSRLFDNATARARVLAMFEAHGIAAERLILHGRVPSNDGHLAFYNGIDVALDPLNYNGTTTTCEALWMGVPVVTLAGDRHAARVGASLLGAANMPELVAPNADAYVALATSLIEDRAALAQRRLTQRAHLQASPLLDAADFARRFEAAIRQAIAP